MPELLQYAAPAKRMSHPLRVSIVGGVVTTWLISAYFLWMPGPAYITWHSSPHCKYQHFGCLDYLQITRSDGAFWTNRITGKEGEIWGRTDFQWHWISFGITACMSLALLAMLVVICRRMLRR